MIGSSLSACVTPCILLPTRVTHSSSTLIDNLYIRTKSYCETKSAVLPTQQTRLNLNMVYFLSTQIGEVNCIQQFDIKYNSSQPERRQRTSQNTPTFNATHPYAKQVGLIKSKGLPEKGWVGWDRK